ncbi:MAG: hypothetical protein U0529_15265 [Thermoanaerobaculia bacterium]
MDEDHNQPLGGFEAAEEFASDPGQRRKLAVWAHRRYGFSQDEVDEVIQETCIDLMQLRGLVRSREGLAFRIFTLRCGKRLRSRKRRPEATGLESVLSQHEGRERAPDERVLLREAFEAMSATCRKLVLAIYLQGARLEELAKAGGWASPKVVSSTASRCLKRLRDRLRGGRI